MHIPVPDYLRRTPLLSLNRSVAYMHTRKRPYVSKHDQLAPPTTRRVTSITVRSSCGLSNFSPHLVVNSESAPPPESSQHHQSTTGHVPSHNNSQQLADSVGRKDQAVTMPAGSKMSSRGTFLPSLTIRHLNNFVAPVPQFG